MENTTVKGIRLTSSLLDGSGYGEAARQLFKMLQNHNLPIQTHIVSFETNKPELGELGKQIETYSNANVQSDINLIELTPDMAVRFLDPNKINVNWFFWECEGLHSLWLDCLNKFDAVITSCDWTKQALTNAGVTKPIYVVPVNVDFSPYTPKENPNLNSTYRFYSIFQWQERKNPFGLLKAYFRAFSDKDDVLMVLKTYLTRMQEGLNQSEMIKNYINSLKQTMQFSRGYPKLYLITDKLTDEELIQIHNECDTYVSLDRGEGFNLPLFSSLIAGNSSIISNYSANIAYASDENSYLVNGQLEPAFGLTPFYPGDICTFFNPNIIEAAEKMRYVFEHREEAFEKGVKARQSIIDNFNEEKIFNIFIKAMINILKSKRR